MIPETNNTPDWLKPTPDQVHAVERKVLQAEINAAAAGQQEARVKAFQAYLAENKVPGLTQADVQVLTRIVAENPTAPAHEKKWDAIIARWEASPEGIAHKANKEAATRAREQKSENQQ